MMPFTLYLSHTTVDSAAAELLSFCAVKSFLLQLCCVVSSSYCTNPGMLMLARSVHFKFTLVLPRADLRKKWHEVHF